MAEAISAPGPISGTDRTLTFETGRLAFQADGAVTARIGDTIVLCTATAARRVREGTDFFPLTVDIEERMYAAGKIPGSFFRREGRATDQATLTARLIDRPLRPSFPEGFRNEVHVVGTVLGADLQNPHDVVAINGASAALMVSGIPFDGPVGAVRVAYSTEGQWIPYPTYEEGDASTFELVVAGRALSEDPDADIAIMMVEAGGTEHAWDYYEAGAPKVTEEVIAGGLEAAKQWIRESIELQRELVKSAGGKKEIIPFELFVDYADDVYERVSRDRRGAPREGQPPSPKSRSATPPSTPLAPRSWPSSPASSRAASARSAPPSARSRRSSSAAASSRRASASTGATRPRSARSPSTSRCSRPPTARACSSGASPRSSTSRRSACRG